MSKNIKRELLFYLPVFFWANWKISLRETWAWICNYLPSLLDLMKCSSINAILSLCIRSFIGPISIIAFHVEDVIRSVYYGTQLISSRSFFQFLIRHRILFLPLKDLSFPVRRARWRTSRCFQRGAFLIDRKLDETKQLWT